MAGLLEAAAARCYYSRQRSAQNSRCQDLAVQGTDGDGQCVDGRSRQWAAHLRSCSWRLGTWWHSGTKCRRRSDAVLPLWCLSVCSFWLTLERPLWLRIKGDEADVLLFTLMALTLYVQRKQRSACSNTKWRSFISRIAFESRRRCQATKQVVVLWLFLVFLAITSVVWYVWWRRRCLWWLQSERYEK